MMLSDVCLSRTSGLSREQRGLGRLKLALTHTPLSRSRSPGRFANRRVGASGVGGRGNVWPRETAATLPSALRRFGAHGGR